MFDKVAVVGEADIVFPLRALGMKVFSPKSLEEARKVMETLEKENFALCFLRKKLCPVVVGFSDHRKVTDHLERMMRELAIKATGSDSLVKKRGEDEAR
jgi:vacuolar-type H+-ATPase subunit F/Vma7